MSDEPNQKPDLGAAFVATNKQKPTSYDLSGTIVVAGTKYRFGAYAKKAKGGGKMPEGATFYAFHRIEPVEGDTSFDPADLEA